MTSSFRSKLVVEDDFGFPFTVYAPFVYDSAILDRTLTIAIGFKTDFASIPRSLWGILSPVGKYDRAAVIHDFLYQTPPPDVTRSQADSVLREAMIVCGVGRLDCFLIYAGVRLGGWVVWGHYRKRSTPILSI